MENIYQENNNLIIFPNYQLMITMPNNLVNNISVLKNIMSKNFKEKPIKFSYYNVFKKSSYRS